MEKLEKFIYSFKYLPPILYFGSVGLILLDIFLDIELIGDKLIIPLWILFFYMSYLGSKNYKSGDFNVLEKFIYSIKVIIIETSRMSMTLLIKYIVALKKPRKKINF